MPRDPAKQRKRVPFLIYCSPEEAELIRRAAKRERRTLTGFFMNAVMGRFAVEDRIQQRKEQSEK